MWRNLQMFYGRDKRGRLKRRHLAVESCIDSSEVSGVYSWGSDCSIAPHSPAKKGKQWTVYMVHSSKCDDGTAEFLRRTLSGRCFGSTPGNELVLSDVRCKSRHDQIGMLVRQDCGYTGVIGYPSVQFGQTGQWVDERQYRPV